MEGQVGGCHARLAAAVLECILGHRRSGVAKDSTRSKPDLLHPVAVNHAHEAMIGNAGSESNLNLALRGQGLVDEVLCRRGKEGLGRNCLGSSSSRNQRAAVLVGVRNPVVLDVPRIGRERQQLEAALVRRVQREPVHVDAARVGRHEGPGNGRPVAAVCVNGVVDPGGWRRQCGPHKRGAYRAGADLEPDRVVVLERRLDGVEAPVEVDRLPRLLRQVVLAEDARHIDHGREQRRRHGYLGRQVGHAAGEGLVVGQDGVHLEGVERERHREHLGARIGVLGGHVCSDACQVLGRPADDGGDGAVDACHPTGRVPEPGEVVSHYCRRRRHREHGARVGLASLQEQAGALADEVQRVGQREDPRRV